MNTRRVVRNNIINNLNIQTNTEQKLEEKLEEKLNNHIQMSLTQEQLLNALKVLKPEVIQAYILWLAERELKEKTPVGN